MRSDMFKVIVERPRHGSRNRDVKGLKRRTQRLALDELPLKQGLCGKWARGRSKCLNEHIAPLRRFLDSRVSRHWDAIFSEICEHIRLDSVVQRHVREHVADYVAEHVEWVNGSWQPKPGGFRFLKCFFVDPRTGILRRMEIEPFKRRRCRGQRYSAPTLVLSPFRHLKRVSGVWYEFELSAVPLERHRAWDFYFRRSVAALCDEALEREYGRLVHASGKRQLNWKEIRDFARKYPESFDH